MLRIGTVPFLVARPLTAGLEATSGIELFPAPPSELARRLAAGELDVALASSILSLERAEHRIWTEGPLIASRRHARSVLLFLRPGLCGPGAVESLVTDPASRTGRALAGIVLRDAFSADFTAREAPPEADPFEMGADAVQLIGDAALEAAIDRDEWTVLDLGETWNDLTRLPFVFAGWIGRRGFDPAEAGECLLAAAERGLALREDLAREASAQKGMNHEFLRRYLMEDITYRLPPDETREALLEFQRRLTQERPSRPDAGRAPHGKKPAIPG